MGRYITADLLAADHEVTVIERQAERCDRLLNEHDILVIRGDATDVRCLEQASIDRADVFVATTHDDIDNFVACQLALGSLGVRRAISRINTPRNEKLFTKLGIEGVSTTTLISRLLREELGVDDLVHLTTLRGGKVNLVEIDVPVEAPEAIRTLSQLSIPREAVVVCVFREDATLIPHAEMTFAPGDRVIALTDPAVETELRRVVLDDRSG